MLIKMTIYAVCKTVKPAIKSRRNREWISRWTNRILISENKEWRGIGKEYRGAPFSAYLRRHLEQTTENEYF